MFSMIRKNNLGTTSFTAKFKGMRKEQEFVVYPKDAASKTNKVTIQSDTRIGQIDLLTGETFLSASIPNEAYGMHLALAKHVETVPEDQLETLKKEIDLKAIAQTSFGIVV